MTNVIREFDGRTVIMTQQQADTLDVLAETRKGGMAVIHGYEPDAAGKSYTVRPKYDATVISRISVPNYYQRCLNALESIDFNQVDFSKYPKLADLDREALLVLFNERKEFLAAGYRRERENAHTVAHVRNYINPCQGVKGNLVTEAQMVDGRKLQIPVQDEQGRYTLKAILLEGLLVNRRRIRNGVPKPSNPRQPTLVSRAIEALMPEVSTSYRRFSLSPETFERVSIDRQTVFSEPDLIA